jgi:MFS transporter, ACS family, D-galactonate transporter
VIYVMGHAIISEITPVPQRAAMLGINNAVATSAGLIGPYVMGSVVQSALADGATAAQGYEHGFLICGLVALVCGLIGAIFLRPQTTLAGFARGSDVAAIPVKA